MSKKYEQVLLEHINCVPFDPEALSYANWGKYVPHTFTNWREETLSWKKFVTFMLINQHFLS